MNKTKPEVLSASTMIGDSIVNSEDEDLGKLEELMIDLTYGNIAYAVVSFGGVLGIGEKLFAVPWEKLKLQKDDHKFLLNVDKERLENASGFDKDDWPKDPDYEWLKGVYDYYGSSYYWE